jgi:2-hydroxychromene-2-carboxylate isomerase
VVELAKAAGVDTAALTEHMNDPLIDETLNATAAQAGALNITGTPAFVFGQQVRPGAIELSMMQELAAAMRKHP